jgi:hypothetical protein
MADENPYGNMDEVENQKTKTIMNTIESINQIKILLDNLRLKFDNLYSENMEYKAKVDVAINSSEEAAMAFDKLMKIASDSNIDISVRNQDVIKKVNEMLEFLTSNKEAITLEILNVFSEKLDDVVITLKSTLDKSQNQSEALTSISMEVNDNLGKINSSILSFNINMENLYKKLSLQRQALSIDQEMKEIINYMKDNYKKKRISIPELKFRFDPNVVDILLLSGEKAGYWKINL